MKTISEINEIRDSVNGKTWPFLVTVGMATCGIAAGASPVLDEVKKLVAEAGCADSVKVKQVGCIGICQHEPVLEGG